MNNYFGFIIIVFIITTDTFNATNDARCCWTSSTSFDKPLIVFLFNVGKFMIKDRCHYIKIRFTS